LQRSTPPGTAKKATAAQQQWAGAARVQALPAQAQGSFWTPVMNRHAVIPVATLVAHHGLRLCMLRAEDHLRAAVRVSSLSAAAASIGQVTVQWVLAELCHIAREPFTQKWENAASAETLAYAEKVNQNDVRSWAVPQVRDSVNAAVCNQIPSTMHTTIQGAVQAADDLMSLAVYGLSLTLGAGAITPMTVLGPLLGAALLFAMSGVQDKLTQQEHDAQRALNAVTAQYADNVQLGNAYNHAIWQTNRQEAQAAYQAACWRRGTARTLSEAALLVLNAYCVMYQFSRHVQAQDGLNPNPEWVADLTKQVPRLNQFCHRTIDLAKDATSFTRNHANLKALRAAIESRHTPDWDNRVLQMLANSDSFCIKNPKGERVSLESVVQDPDVLLQPGRWTVRARNGSGKSTLLNVLKALKPDAIHYIPVKHGLAYHAQQGSAGQTLVRQLAETIRCVQVPIVLLDEWPANLDAANTAGVHAVLQDYSRYVAVVEVRNDEEERARLPAST
jgi:hypothetical protein